MLLSLKRVVSHTGFWTVDFPRRNVISCFYFLSIKAWFNEVAYHFGSRKKNSILIQDKMLRHSQSNLYRQMRNLRICRIFQWQRNVFLLIPRNYFLWTLAKMSWWWILSKFKLIQAKKNASSTIRKRFFTFCLNF